MVHPAKSAISLLAVSCLIAVVIEYTYVNSVTGCMMHRFCTYIREKQGAMYDNNIVQDARWCLVNPLKLTVLNFAAGWCVISRGLQADLCVSKLLHSKCTQARGSDEYLMWVIIRWFMLHVLQECTLAEIQWHKLCTFWKCPLHFHYTCFMFTTMEAYGSSN